MKNYPMRVVDKILLILQAVVSALLVAMVAVLNVLPTHYLVALPLLLLIFLLLLFLMLWRHKSRIAGRIISLLLSVLMALGSFYVFKTHTTITQISGANTKLDDVSVIVMASDLAESVDDIATYRIGVQTLMDRTNTENVVAQIETELQTTLNTADYLGVDSQVDGLYNGEVKAIILNEGYRSLVEESHTGFSEETRVLASYQLKSDVTINQTTSDVTQESFTMYISGIDVYGSISTTSRTDVNILATVNPATNQVLLTTTPRDYFVDLPFADYAKDKLTHTGIYGVDASIDTLENLYGVEIDYYVRVNFTSLENIVDALGGITVNSEKTFTTIAKTGGYTFYEGENEMNGAEALAFSRERKAFSEGDIQRGRNQMAVIKGIINKAISPTMITNYVSVLDSVSDCMETNMSTDQITSLVKKQMQDGGSWDVLSSNVTGTGSYSSTYSMAQQLWVMIPDDESVSKAQQRMNAVLNGESLTQAEIDADKQPDDESEALTE